MSMLTCIAGTTGRPQINLPLAAVGGLPVGLSLLGARGADEVLLAFARDLATGLVL
jgi:amidase